MQRAFKNLGFARPPFVVHDGSEAIAYIDGQRQYGDRNTYPFPEVVILDLKMPRLNGFEVLEWLQSHPELQTIPTLVWSSSADPVDVKRAYCLGANGYLCKPNDFQKFKELLTHVVNFWDACLKPMPNLPPTCEELAKIPAFHS